MKQIFLKKLTIAAIALCALPATLLAQKEKEEKVETAEKKEKKERQQIIITRTGDKEEKTVIEINGDKVKVNGKDVADLKDIQVRVNNMKMPNVMALRSPGTFSMSFDDEHGGLFREDANRAMLGVNTDESDKGARLESVVKESAAEKAGLKKGDIITKINDKKIEATSDVTAAIKAHKPGDKVNITYLRDGKEQKATAELTKWKGMNMTTFTGPQGFDSQMWRESINTRPAVPRISGTGATFYRNNSGLKLGLSVQDTDDGKGVKVLEIDENGNAAKAGLKENDIITQIDDKAVNGADEIAKVMREKKDQATVRFQLTRAGKPQTIEVKVPRKIKTVEL
ncbi:MAG TPA: PDZ domain-containing protein [Flavisolibacter sp.]|jgi:serine protease Do|nr:PDZ domain-containing protein [Flavisolibacter sp.]